MLGWVDFGELRGYRVGVFDCADGGGYGRKKRFYRRNDV